MIAAVHIGLKVKRPVLAVPLHGLHIRRQLNGQKTARLCAAADDAQHRLQLHAEIHQNRIAGRLELRKHAGIVHPDDGDHRLAAHCLAGFQHKIQIAFVGSRAALSPVAAVGVFPLAEVALRDAVRPRGMGGIGPVLQGNRVVALLRAVAAVGNRAFDEHNREIRFLR